MRRRVGYEFEPELDTEIIEGIMDNIILHSPPSINVDFGDIKVLISHALLNMSEKEIKRWHRQLFKG